MRKPIPLLAVMFAAIAIVLSLCWTEARPAPQQRQDVISIGIPLSLEPARLAVADFRPAGADTDPLVRVFNQVLWNDLDNSGVVTLVSKSFYPPAIPGRREDLAASAALAAWGRPPTNAQNLAFGNAALISGSLVVEGYLYDIASARPEVLARRYTDIPDEAGARRIAHRFANAILEKLGDALPGIAESRIYFVRSTRPGIKDIWVMDYDGANARPITQYNSLALTPAVSPTGDRIAFTSYSPGEPQIFMFSLASLRRLPFNNPRAGLNTTPSFSPDGSKIAFSSSLTGDSEIYVSNADGSSLRRLTNSRGVDIYPVWNPKTGAQIAFVSGRGGTPQVYVMDADGTGVRRVSGGGGDAVTPAWSPNGQVLAFSWTRGFAIGNYNIFLVDVASGQLVQLTHGAGANEHPSFSPDGRHIVFESDRAGRQRQIFTMLADGTKVRALTSSGNNTAPVWSPK